MLRRTWERLAFATGGLCKLVSEYAKFLFIPNNHQVLARCNIHRVLEASTYFCLSVMWVCSIA